MTKVKYRAWDSFCEIKTIKFDRETEKSVWIEVYGRTLKQSDTMAYFDTWEEAKECLLKYSQRKVDDARENVAQYEKKHAKIEALVKG